MITRLLLHPTLLLIIFFAAFILTAQGIGHMMYGEVLTFAVNNPGGNVDSVFLLDTVRGIAIPMLRFPHQVNFFAFSPDGEWIAYVQELENGSDLWTTNLRSNEEYTLHLSDHLTQFIGWSREGNLAFDFYTINAIHILNIAGESLRTTWSTLEERGGMWSPDGEFIAFGASLPNQEQYSSIYVMELTGENIRPISNQVLMSDESPSWSPDGQYIMYNSLNWQLGISALIIVGVTDGETRSIHFEDFSPVFYGQWSQDSAQILFTAQHDLTGNYDTYIINIDGTGLVNLSSSQADDFRAIWSPDDSEILFYSNRTGAFHIYSVNPDATDLHCVTCDLVPNASSPAFLP